MKFSVAYVHILQRIGWEAVHVDGMRRVKHYYLLIQRLKSTVLICRLLLCTFLLHCFQCARVNNNSMYHLSRQPASSQNSFSERAPLYKFSTRCNPARNHGPQNKRARLLFLTVSRKSQRLYLNETQYWIIEGILYDKRNLRMISTNVSLCK